MSQDNPNNSPASSTTSVQPTLPNPPTQSTPVTPPPPTNNANVMAKADGGKAGKKDE